MLQRGFWGIFDITPAKSAFATLPRSHGKTAKEPTVPYRSVNPATGEVLKTFPEHTDQEMLDALATADRAFTSWSALAIADRSKIMSRAAELLIERRDINEYGKGCHGHHNQGEPRKSTSLLSKQHQEYSNGNRQNESASQRENESHDE